jgi:hypothetical protein
MKRSAIDRDGIAFVVVLLAATAWFTAARYGALAILWDLRDTRFAFTPWPAPRGIDFTLVTLPSAMLLEETVSPGHMLTALGSVLALALLATGLAVWRLRGPLSRRVTRLPVRLGVLALVVGVVADARSLAHDHAVFGWLGYRYTSGADLPEGIGGEPGLLGGGALLALAGLALTAGLALASARVTRRSSVPEGDT